MANFQNNVITDVGRVMFGDVQMGKTLIPTKIVIGSGRIPAGKTARTMTEVVSPVTELTISKKQKSNDGTAIFGGVYSNENIESDFYFRELALFAKAGDDGNEVLFSYGNAGETADYMLAYTSGTPVQRVIDLAIYVGNDTKVDLTIEGGLYIPTDEKGVAGGVATLDGDGKVPEDQLPAVDPTFDELMNTYSYTWTMQEAEDTGDLTIVVTLGEDCPVSASMTAVISEGDSGETVVDVTTVIDGVTSKSQHTINDNGGEGGPING